MKLDHIGGELDNPALWLVLIDSDALTHAIHHKLNVLRARQHQPHRGRSYFYTANDKRASVMLLYGATEMQAAQIAAEATPPDLWDARCFADLVERVTGERPGA